MHGLYGGSMREADANRKPAVSMRTINIIRKAPRSISIITRLNAAKAL